MRNQKGYVAGYNGQLAVTADIARISGGVCDHGSWAHR